MKNINKLLYRLILLSFIIFSSFSCAKKDSGIADSTSSIDDWQIDTPTSINVSSTQPTNVTDNKTGVTFNFPNGGNGTLKIASIISGPTVPVAGAKQFRVEYTGSDEIEIKVANQSGVTGTLYYYGSIGHVCSNKVKSQENWWPVNEMADNGTTTTYRLTLPGTGLSKRSAYTPPPSNYFAFATIAQGSSDAQLLAGFRQTVDQVLDLWLSNLPDDIRQTMRTRSNVLGYTIRLVNEGSAYAAGNSILFSNSVLYLRRNANLGVIAHEVGHRMTHVLLGYDRHMEIYGLFPADLLGSQLDHEPGKLWTRNAGTLEDYAYFSEYIATGVVSDAYDLSNVARINNFADVSGNASATSLDYAAIESFPTAMLISLMRTRDSVYTYDFRSVGATAYQRARVPVVNTNLTGALSILARGPQTVEEMRSFIQDFLTDRGGTISYAMPALFEPLGWSYSGSGKLVDGKNQPIVGAHVQNIYQDGSSASGYRTTLSTQTGSDGSYYLPRIFPGTSILRVFVDKDSTDFPFTVSWPLPTNTPLVIPTFTVDASEPWVDYLTTTTDADAGFTARSSTKSLSLSFTNYMPGNTKIIWSGTSFAAQWNTTGGYGEAMTGSMSGSVNLKTKKATFSGTSTITTKPSFTGSYQILTAEIALTNIPYYDFETLYGSDGITKQITFAATGATAGSAITAYSVVTTYISNNSDGTERRDVISSGLSDLIIDSNTSMWMIFTGK